MACIRLALGALLGLLILPGCSSYPANLAAGQACVRSAQCSGGLVCSVGQCTADLTMFGGGHPTVLDAGPPTDAALADDAAIADDADLMPMDTGPLPDVGPLPDTGPVPIDSGTDAGPTPVDAATPVDAFTPPVDAATPVDAFVPADDADIDAA